MPKIWTEEEAKARFHSLCYELWEKCRRDGVIPSPHHIRKTYRVAAPTKRQVRIVCALTNPPTRELTDRLRETQLGKFREAAGRPQVERETPRTDGVRDALDRLLAQLDKECRKLDITIRVEITDKTNEQTQNRRKWEQQNQPEP